MSTNLQSNDLKDLLIPSFKIDCREYLTPVLTFSPKSNKMILDLKKIKNLNEPIIESDEVSLSIMFPFKSPHVSKLISETDHLSKRHIIDFIRKMFVTCYRNLSTFPCDIKSEGKFNQLYELTYPINCLFVEGVFFNEKENKITINVSGNPIVRKEPDYPF